MSKRDVVQNLNPSQSLPSAMLDQQGDQTHICGEQHPKARLVPDANYPALKSIDSRRAKDWPPSLLTNASADE